MVFLIVRKYHFFSMVSSFVVVANTPSFLFTRQLRNKVLVSHDVAKLYIKIEKIVILIARWFSNESFLDHSRNKYNGFCPLMMVLLWEAIAQTGNATK